MAAEYCLFVLSAVFSPGTGIALTGPSAALTALARDLRSEQGSLTMLALRDPSPYDISLTSIDRRRSDGPVLVSVTETQLQVSGTRSALDLLAENLESFARDPASARPGAHMHIEWFPDHFYLAEQSEPLVVAIS